MIAFIFRPSRGGVKSRLWSARIRLDGWPCARTVPLKVSDKRVAQQKLAETVREMEREAIGIAAPREAREAACRGLESHLTAFLADLQVRGRSPRTLLAYRNCIRKLASRCGWVHLRDVNAESFVTWRARSKARPKFLNDVLGYASSLLNWLVRQGALVANPLAKVERVRVPSDRAHRRALSREELARLLVVVPVRRATVYLTAYKTGLRRRELNALKWEYFDLESARPCVRVPGTVTKNRKDAVLSLTSDVVTALRTFRGDALPFEWAFRGRVPNMDTFKRDLARAGISQLDESGRRVDFHALRTTLCTHLHAEGVSPRAAMEIMRHSDMRLTMRTYTDANQLPLAAELARLPSFAIQKADAQISAQTAVVTGQNETQGDALGQKLAT